MDYEKIYKEALKRAEAYNNVYKDHTMMSYAKGALEYIFPELAVSEDEKTRKEMIVFIQETIDNVGESPNIWTMSNAKKWIAWLEKQGEQKPTNKIEPKFKVGDWVTNGIDFTFKVMSIRDDMYCRDDDYSIDIKTADKTFRLWTIQDAKDGDVLTIGNEYFLFKEKKENTSPAVYISHCFSDFAGAFRVTNGRDCGEFLSIENGVKACPATKEQRDILFSKMKEAGYEWDAWKKELKKIDDYCQDNCKGFQETGKCYADGEYKAKRETEQNPAWSEDDEKIIDDLTQIISQYTVFAHREPKEIIQWLKSLKPQPRWKPTEEQMNLLGEVQQALLGKDCHNRFVNFMYDLKKL